jgi:hypothetical protein
LSAIRALDWRFLLPLPDERPVGRLVLVGATDEEAELASAAGVAEEIARELREGLVADAVVCLEPAAVDLGEAAGSLRPGGALYLELPRGRASRTLRQLRALGLRLSGLYWPEPNFRTPSVYLPLDAPLALEWYFRNIFVIRDTRARLLLPLARIATRLLGARLGHVVPRVCVVAVAGDGEQRASVLSAPVLPDEIGNAGNRLLVLMPETEWSRVVLLPFARGGRRPIAAVKLWRFRGREQHLEHEREGQRLVRELLPRPLRDAVPEPLGVLEWRGLTGNAETCVAGEWLFAHRHRKRLLTQRFRELQQVSDWLIAFNERVQVDCAPWSDEQAARWVSDSVAAYRRAFGTLRDEDRLFDALERRALELDGTRLPIVWCHNDFSELNVYWAPGSIGIVDWETIGPGLPAWDLLRYVSRWFFRAQRATADERHAFQSLFLAAPDHGRAARAARAALEGCSERLRLDERVAPLLLTTAWITRAVALHERSLPAEDAGAGRRANRFTDYVELIARNTALLFERPYRWGRP